MPRMRIAVPHNLGKQEALTRIKNLLRDLLRELKTKHRHELEILEENWSGNKGTFSFSVKGFSVSGELVVEAHQVRLNGNLPWAALPFRGKIESTIRGQAVKLLR